MNRSTPVKCDSHKTLELANLLVERLERLPPDSVWARRASGSRGALLRLIDCVSNEPSTTLLPYTSQLERLKRQIEFSFDLLEKAARELSE
jgi:hypothetical protein